MRDDPDKTYGQGPPNSGSSPLPGAPPASAVDSTASVADALRRRAADWAAGGEEGRELDRQIARQQGSQERLDSARELVDLAAKLRPAS